MALRLLGTEFARAAHPKPSAVSLLFLRGRNADGRVRALVADRQGLRPMLASLALVRRRGFEPLGSRSVGDYARERLGLTARAVRESARVWEALPIWECAEAIAAEALEAWARSASPHALDAALRRALRRLEAEVGSAPGAGGGVTFSAPVDSASVFLLAVEAVRLHLSEQPGGLADEGSALAWMLAHAIAAWTEQGEQFPDYADFERDGWRCTMPGCTARRNLHSHHIVFRSASGPDETWNRTTLCAFHHHRGVHAGVVQCSGRAPDGLRFALGVRRDRPPLLRARSKDVLMP